MHATDSDEKLTALRRTITPYIGQTVIFSAVTAFCVFVSYWKSEWGFMWGVLVIWACFSILVYIGFQYLVLWNSNILVMRASGGPERRIRFEDITDVKVERAPVSEFLSQPRPFRRIVVYEHRAPAAKYIDISLRHFRPSDIDDLLAEIRARRPDLSVPIVPWGKGSL